MAAGQVETPAPTVMQRLRHIPGTGGAFILEQSPGAGIVHLRLVGAGSTVNVQFAEGGPTYTLNAGSVLISGAMYEFIFAVDRGESIFISAGPTLVAAFWRPR